MKGLEYLHVPSDEISSTDWNPNHHYYWAGIGQHGFNHRVMETLNLRASTIIPAVPTTNEKGSAEAAAP